MRMNEPYAVNILNAVISKDMNNKQPMLENINIASLLDLFITIISPVFKNIFNLVCTEPLSQRLITPLLPQYGPEESNPVSPGISRAIKTVDYEPQKLYINKFDCYYSG